MNIEEQEENSINIKTKHNKGQIDEEQNLLSKKRLRYTVIKNNNI